MAIDIGADAIDRTYAAGNTIRKVCLIEGSNPATVAGKITRVYIYVHANAGAGKVGTFYKTNGDTFTSRDYETTGALYTGLNEKEVGLDVEIGDYIGINLPPQAAGNGIDLDYDASWGDYWRQLADDDFPYTDYVFDNLGKRIISLYGSIGVAFIPKIMIF